MSKQGSSRSGASRHDNTSQAPAWVWLFTGAVLGGFVMFLLHLGDLGPTSEQAEGSVIEQTGKDTISTQESEQLPRFDFYERLKELTVKLPDTSPPAPASKEEKSSEVILQVASFQNMEDADTLRAELILLNLEARIEKVSLASGEIWHRVLVGPFSSRSFMSKARETLLSNGHQALVLKRQQAE